MFPEISTLLRECAATAGKAEYAAAIIESNCLSKHTAATRELTRQRLSELYGLDPGIPLFRVMRRLWDIDGNGTGRPLLALLTAMARDPLFRATASVITRMREGEELARQQMTDVLLKHAGDRWNEDTLDKVVRNASASWTQCGHLTGRSRKFRRLVQPSPPVVAYALLLGFMLGSRGTALFETLWTSVLDASSGTLIQLATDARRLGFIDIKHSGGIVAVSFEPLLTDAERKIIDGSH